MKKGNVKDDKARVRVFFGEIEGDNDTIRDGLRSIAEAVNKTFQQETRVVRVLASSTDPNQKHLVDEFENIIDVEVENNSEQEDVRAVNIRKSKSSKSKKAPSYSFVKDLNLRPEGRKSLRDFYSEKKPNNQQEQMVVILYYLFRTIELQNITLNHMYTGMKDLTELGVRVPGDIGGVLRNTANRKGWLDSSDADSLKTTVSGDNFVEHDLPSNKVENSKK